MTTYSEREDAAAASNDAMGTPLLKGVRVLAFAHWLQGPAACQYLADLGAEVIKVEPLGGAAERNVVRPGRGPDGASSVFVCGNRNQRSLAVDLKSAAGQQVIRSLVADYDIVIENFRPGVMDKLGFGYEDLREINPGVIFASASGYGSSGPMAGKPGQDLLAQALTGLAAASGGISPTPIGAAVIDQHGAALLAFAVLAAVTRRSSTGEGCLIEASLFNAGVDLQMEALTFYLNRDDGPFDADLLRRRELGTWYHPAPYGMYETSDGHVAVSLVETVTLQAAFPERLGGLEGLDPVADRDAYVAIVADVLRDLTSDEALAALDAHGIWNAPVLSYEQLESHPQMVHNDLIAEVGDEEWSARVVRHPVKYDGQIPPVLRNPPRIGQHTVEVLRELSLSDDAIESMLSNRTVVDGAVTTTALT
jgi:crotonobetainyl-CoA:carnitine CoA-transferase CaiB-like acyl-CoA transferase